jgi:hypothetical protein
MTKPPTRADQVRMASSAGRRQPPRQATITAIDLDDDNLRPDAWFVYVMPIQSGVELMGAGRYGYWETQPTVEYDGDCIVITGRSVADGEDAGPGEEEPIFIAPKASIISVHVAQSKHIEATPFPVAQPEPAAQ